MRIPSGPFYCVALLHVTSALYAGKFCPAACDFTLNYATFNDTDPWLSPKVRSCRSELRITSLYLCFDEYCESDGSGERWVEDQRPWCDEHAGVRLPDLRDVLSRWARDDRTSLQRLGYDELKASPPLNEVTLPAANLMDRAYTTMDIADRQYKLHLTYGWYMYYFWIVIVTFGTSTRLTSLIARSIIQEKSESAAASFTSPSGVKRRSIVSRPKAWIKRHITIPATFGDRCSQPYGWCTIPPRVQSLTICVFVMLNFWLSVCSYQLTDGNLYWPEKAAQLFRYVSDRTGIISLANFPLVWLFGMRNDAMMWMTGWGFGTYNAFHRWVARVATVQAVVHSLGYTYMILKDSGWSGFLEYWERHYFWNGELSTVAMCALLLFSLYGIRRSHYEIFLVTHIVLSIVALWTMYYHVEIFTKGDYNVFIWPCLAIWILDRVFRAGRIIAFNRHFWNTQATVSYDPASNIVRMDVDGSKNFLAPQPGTYYYVHVLNDILYAHQNHPFTLAYTSSEIVQPCPTPSSPLSSRPSHHRTFSEESTESDSLLVPNTKKSLSNLVFLIRPYDGFTSRLKSHCLLHPKKLRVLIEGPYGHSEPLYHSPNVLFIVGGTGIAVPLSHISRLLSSISRTQCIKIVWAVREHAFLASVLRDFSGLLGDERVYMEVHITQDEEVESEVLGEDIKSVRIVTQRPDVFGTVNQAAEDAGQRGLTIVACGPASMADQARKASVEMLARGHRGVEYLEESFKW
ncbi:hypothetical protein HBI04_160270 [Parastagonospora nodorum]|nr:hypothetical protein HBI03_165270 [Parastagonospora nodorum]KAH4269783.1 hypothetical protein HBI04_160270 [Parastagonospora nodorum]KAH4930181.1 hypothetical protein HBI79_119110 [Parastagonospora nodorum]KAH5306126.1 hypothetical protein HBI50_183310 [Parastagonospora nodorum]KAH5341401.1 hypothetical protein HBI48_233160 [Parastagonospora nodorum]